MIYIHQQKDLENELKLENQKNNKRAYDHFKESDNRGIVSYSHLYKGFNIISSDVRLVEYKTQLKLRNKDSDWDKVVKYAGGKLKRNRQKRMT